VFVVVKSVSYDPATMQLDVGELKVFLGPCYAIVVARGATDVLAGVRRRLDDRPAVAAVGPMAALWALLDTVFDDAEGAADLFVDHGERIAQAAFEGDGDQSEPIYLHLRRVERLERAVHPALAILDTLERGEPVGSPEGVQPFAEGRR
jgi:magnesium transporter